VTDSERYADEAERFIEALEDPSPDTRLRVRALAEALEAFVNDQFLALEFQDPPVAQMATVRVLYARELRRVAEDVMTTPSPSEFPAVVRPDGLPTPETVSMLQGVEIAPYSGVEGPMPDWYTVTLDVVVEPDSTAFQTGQEIARRHKLVFKVLSWSGPGGGWPEIKLTGPWPNLWGYLKEYFQV
jgi:hypothetical protein